MCMDTYTNIGLFLRLQIGVEDGGGGVFILFLFWCNLMICAVILIVVRSD